MTLNAYSRTNPIVPGVLLTLGGMHLLRAAILLGSASALMADLQPSKFVGSSALEYTRKTVAFGPRPSGSPACARLQNFIRTELRKTRSQVTEDAFTATTPDGMVKMSNIIAHFPGSSGKAIAITGHYDTKKFKDFSFAGANDGGSSTGVLLELARVLSTAKFKDDVYVVFFDGEEALHDWTSTDSVYGSRHLAERWAADGTLKRIKALINVDMIGDRDLNLVQETRSSAGLLSLVWKVAQDLGYGKYFSAPPEEVEDDHVPFLSRGVNALDLIDFDYGPGNSYWHQSTDTMDKLSANSLQVVGSVLIETINRLEK